MDTFVRTDLAERFATAIAEGAKLDALSMHEDGKLSVAWAPFDHVPATARLVVVGITPGRQQAMNALAAFRVALATGAGHTEALRRAKLTGAFSGSMRGNLVAMLDRIGVPGLLGLGSATELFDPRRELAHLTSALRHPVLVGGKDYNGTPDMLRTPALRRIVETYLADEARALPRALWLPLGPKPLAALAHLVALGILDRGRILGGLPHPSGANAERVAYFLGRKSRAALSAKTRPEPLDLAREQLTARIAHLRTAT